MGPVIKSTTWGVRMDRRALGGFSLRLVGLGGLVALGLAACGGGTPRAASLPPPEYEVAPLPAYDAPRRADPLDALRSTPDLGPPSDDGALTLPAPGEEALAAPPEASSSPSSETPASTPKTSEPTSVTDP